MADDVLPIEGPVPLDPSHDHSSFDCGSEALNDFLRRFALTNQQNQAARTYVVTRGERVVGYHTLAAGSIGHAEAPARGVKGLARPPVPGLLLARLAVDQAEQGKKLGAALLKDALSRCVQVAELIGCRAVL